MGSSPRLYIACALRDGVGVESSLPCLLESPDRRSFCVSLLLESPSTSGLSCSSSLTSFHASGVSCCDPFCPLPTVAFTRDIYLQACRRPRISPRTSRS